MGVADIVGPEGDACGAWQFVYISAEPCGFSTLFCIAMVTHVTARDVSMTRRRNFKIMPHLSYKSSSFAETSVPIHSETSASGLKEVTLSFSRVSFDVL